MNTRAGSFPASAGQARASTLAKGLGGEAQAFVQALWSPQRLIDEVLAMRMLFDEAARIEAQEPARAAELRRRAAAMCSR
jgi:hypothetical protein